ncbi:MAG: NADH:flavin oxidoreductase/NADH oxidase [Parafilimonas sp.]|nr:NADH:flavin oxidoreductase/NADH oxidase [Parafilimonas sp.]
MALLFEPLSIRSIQFKNRIVVSPMCEYSSEDGFANDWHLVHLGSRAVGGAGLIIAEATAVSPEGRITPDDLGIWKDAHIDFLKRITAFIEAHGSVPGIQLAHAGRKASHSSPWKGNRPLSQNEGGWTTLAPSAVAYKETDPLPRKMSTEDIEQLKNDFTNATLRAMQAGFKVIELHAAHGYLLNEFLSPLSNHRTDDYGGCFENRVRLLLEVVDAVRSVLTETLPLFVRISASEWVEGGWSIEDSVQLAKLLKNKAVDMIDCSSGGNISTQKITVKPLYQVPFAERIKKEAGIATAAVGMITTAEECEEILQRGQADLVIMARQLLRDPYFPLHAAKKLNTDIPWPVQYERAKLK